MNRAWRLSVSCFCYHQTNVYIILTFVYIYIYIYIFTYPFARVGYDTWSVFKRSLTSLNSEFSFSKTSCLTKAEELSLPYYLPIAGGRIIGFMLFPRVLVLCEMQSVSSRIWTRVVSIIIYIYIYCSFSKLFFRCLVNKNWK